MHRSIAHAQFPSGSILPRDPLEWVKEDGGVDKVSKMDGTGKVQSLNGAGPAYAG